MAAAGIRRYNQDFWSVRIHGLTDADRAVFRIPTSVGSFALKENARLKSVLRNALFPNSSSNVNSDSIWPGLRLFIEFPARFLHLALQPLNLDQVLRIEGQRRVIAIRFVGAEAAVRCLFPAGLHSLGQPQTLEVPIVVAAVSNRRQIFPGGQR